MYNLFFVVVVVCFSSQVLSGLTGGEVEPLTSTEADAIVESEESAKESRKAALLAELSEAEVLSEGEVILPDSSKVIVREVAPPEVEPSTVDEQVVSSLPAESEVISADLLDWQEARAEEAALTRHKVLMLSCTVFDRSITRVQWNYEDEKYLAYTNADFNYLCGVHTVKTETDVFDYFMGIGDVSSENANAEPLPDLSAFSAEESEYVLVEGSDAAPEAVAGLEALLAHYDANLEKLKVQYQRTLALSEARKRYKENNPKEPEDFIIQFWVPEEGGSDQ